VNFQRGEKGGRLKSRLRKKREGKITQQKKGASYSDLRERTLQPNGKGEDQMTWVRWGKAGKDKAIKK